MDVQPKQTHKQFVGDLIFNASFPPCRPMHSLFEVHPRNTKIFASVPLARQSSVIFGSTFVWWSWGLFFTYLGVHITLVGSHEKGLNGHLFASWTVCCNDALGLAVSAF